MPNSSKKKATKAKAKHQPPVKTDLNFEQAMRQIALAPKEAVDEKMKKKGK